MMKRVVSVWIVLLTIPPLANAQSRAVAISVDDLPFATGSTPEVASTADATVAEKVNKKILCGLARHHAPAIGFLIEQRAEQLGATTSDRILRQWLKPGFDLGNHFYSHADVNKLTMEQVEQEIIGGEKTLQPLLASLSRKPEYLRFPYNHTGDTPEKRDAIAAFLAGRGYRLAPCTIENSDWEFNWAYARALRLKDRKTAARIRREYLAYTATMIDWYSGVNKKVLGREPTEVMLLHDSQLNADTIDEVLTLFEKRGYRFVSLADALKDPAYPVPETYVSPYGPMWGYRWARERGVKLDTRDEPRVPAWVQEYEAGR